MGDTWTKEEFWAKLDAIGEPDVRVKFATGEWRDNIRSGLVTIWLKSKDDERSAISSSKRDARESKAISLASRANLIAISAFIIAVIAAHKEIKWLINSVMVWFR